MAQAGDAYTISLKPSHLDWGEYRNSSSRDSISGEGYIPIPKKYAVRFGIYNSNHTSSGFGSNLFHASSTDGFLNNVTLLAQGCSHAGDIYAKQFSVQDNLKTIGAWYNNCKATISNSVRVSWINPTTVLLEII